MAKQQQGVSRRRFGTVLAKAGAVSLPLAAFAQGPGAPGQGEPGQGGQGPGFGNPFGNRTAPSDRIVFGGIGVRGRGLSSVRYVLASENTQFVAVADVNEIGRETVKSAVDEYYKNNDCVTYNEPTELLARSDIDALVIATSDRWHAPMAAWAAQSGKDMYEEKPAAMSMDEAFALADNVNRYGIVYQSGCQRKNGFNFEFAVGLARSGKLGRLLEVHADTSIGLGVVDQGGHGWWAQDEPDPDPAVFDWDKWLGPCLWRPYNSNYYSGGRGNFWDTHAGLLEWASHTVAMAQWAADMEDQVPITYEPEGGDFRGDGLTGRYTIYCTYANGVKLILRNHSWDGHGSCSNRFVGTDGWVETGDSGTIGISDNLKHLVPTTEGPMSDATQEHVREYLHAIRARVQCRANATKTAYTHVASHAAYICGQLNRKVTWDPVKREFLNDSEATRMRHRTYRAPWRMEGLATSM